MKLKWSLFTAGDYFLIHSVLWWVISKFKGFSMSNMPTFLYVVVLAGDQKQQYLH